MNGYLKISEVSEKWGIKERRINTLCLEGRIEGAVKFGNTWAIPENAEKPKDERVKSGKYIKNRAMALHDTGTPTYMQTVHSHTLKKKKPFMCQKGVKG